MRPPIWYGTVEFKDGKDRLKLDNPQRFTEYLASKRRMRVQFVLSDYDPVSKSDRGYYYAEIIPAFAEHMGYPPEEKDQVHGVIKEMMGIESTKKFKAIQWKEYVEGVKRKAGPLGIMIREKKHIDMEAES